MKAGSGFPGLVLVGVISFMVALVANVPARIVIPTILPQEPVTEMRSIGGTVWSGSGRLFIDGVEIGALGWRVRPSGLMPGGSPVDWTLNAHGGEVAGGLRPAGGGILVRGVGGSLPASALEPYLPVPAALGGSIVIDFDRIVIDETIAELDGTVRWIGASVDIGGPVGIGDLRATLRNQDDGSIAINIEDAGGPLELRGGASLKDGTLLLALRVRAGRDADSALRNALVLLGEADRNGWYSIGYRGTL